MSLTFTQKRGNISEGNFTDIAHKCFAQCELTSQEMSKVINIADKNEAGRFLYDSFYSNAYNFALAMKKERVEREALQSRSSRKRSMSANENYEGGPDTLLVPPTKAALESLSNAMFSQISLESRGGELVIHFAEESSAVSGKAIKKASRERQQTKIMQRKNSLGGHRMTNARDFPFADGATKDARGLIIEEVKDLKLYTCTVTCRVVNESGENLDTNDNVIVAMGKGVVLQDYSFTCTVTMLSDEEKEERLKSGEVGFGEDELLITGSKSGYEMKKFIKMPSLAMCDDEAAKMFAQNVTGNLEVVKTEGGAMRIGLRRRR